jgi:Complex I intermediate-associated protein 30 (CIA30)
MNRRILPWALLLLSAATPALHAEGRVLKVDDFEDGDRRAASGLSWISIADDLMGGASFADLDVIAAGGARSGRALRVSGEVAAEGFAGAWVALDGGARAADASDFSGLRLRVRGPGALKVLVRGGPMAGFNYAAPVEARAGWTIMEVPFQTLTAVRPGSPAFDPRTVRWLGVGVGANRTGRYEFAIDDVELYAARDDARLRVQAGPTMTVAFKGAPETEQPGGPWKELARDAPDDGKQKRLPDATGLATYADEAHDRVWFRVPLSGPVPTRWLGVNLALDIDGDSENGMAWWGTNKAFRFDRLVTVYGSATDSGYEGMFGIADAAEVEAGNLVGSQPDAVRLVLDRASPAFVVGIPASALGPSKKGPVRLVAAVGSAFQHNDDVPNEGAAVLAR